MNHSAAFTPEQEARWKMLDPARGPDPFVEQRLAPLLSPESRVLEYGAGRGRNALPLAAQGCAVEATDLSAEAVADLAQSAQKLRLAVRARAADAADYVADGTDYDAILCLRLLHFVRPKENAWTILERMRTLTRPGALVALALFTRETSHLPEFFFPSRDEILAAFPGWEVEFEGTQTKVDSKKPDRPMYELSLVLRKPA